jgi:hypothetical protein
MPSVEHRGLVVIDSPADKFMSLSSTQLRLERAKQARMEAEAELKAERQIATENRAASKARVALLRKKETATQKAEREEFARKLAVAFGDPLMGPDWRDYCQLSEPKAHRGGSES